MFITVEGVEGAGKSTACGFIREWFEERGADVICLREPGSTRLGEKVREIMLGGIGEQMDGGVEALLATAARMQNIQHNIKPALLKGQVVICDRFDDSTYAYQGWGRGADSGIIAGLGEMVQEQVTVDLTFLLDLPVEVGRERISNRGKDRIEKEDIAFFERVREGFLKRGGVEYRVVFIDANRKQVRVRNQIRSELERRLPNYNPV